MKYLLEVCDPCQAVWYPVNGVPVSDFFIPRYFDPVAIEGGRYSFTGELKKPLDIAEGGYLSWIDPEDSGLYQLLAGDRGTGACGQPARAGPQHGAAADGRGHQPALTPAVLGSAAAGRQRDGSEPRVRRRGRGVGRRGAAHGGGRRLAGHWRGLAHRLCVSVIVDAHTDVVLELLVGPGEEPTLELFLRHGSEGVFERYWLPRLEAAGVGIQVCPLYGACAPGPGRADGRWPRRPSSGARSRRTRSGCAWSARARSSRTRVCGIVLSMEGVEPLEGDPGRVRGVVRAWGPFGRA